MLPSDVVKELLGEMWERVSHASQEDFLKGNE
jgi:hypothetical protein